MYIKGGKRFYLMVKLKFIFTPQKAALLTGVCRHFYTHCLCLRGGKSAREIKKERERNVLLLIVYLTILFSTISLNESRISMTQLTKHSCTHKYCNMPQSYQTQTDSHTHTHRDWGLRWVQGTPIQVRRLQTHTIPPSVRLPGTIRFSGASRKHTQNKTSSMAKNS